MPDKHAVLDANTLTDKCVARYLASLANDRPSLNFNEGTDLRLGTYGATVQIYKIWVMDNHAFPKSDIISDHRFSLGRDAAVRGTVTHTDRSCWHVVICRLTEENKAPSLLCALTRASAVEHYCYRFQDDLHIQ